MNKTISIKSAEIERMDKFRPIPEKGRRRSYSEVIELAMDALEERQMREEQINRSIQKLKNSGKLSEADASSIVELKHIESGKEKNGARVTGNKMDIAEQRNIESRGN